MSALLIALVGSLTLPPDPAYGFASALNISRGRPTQFERDSNKLFFITDPATANHTMEVLIYVDGLESGKEYEFEVEGLISEEVPTLPPADPRN